MDLADYDEIADYWKDYPPIHRMIAHYMGIKPKKKEAQKPEGDDLAELFNMFPGGAIR